MPFVGSSGFFTPYKTKLLLHVGGLASYQDSMQRINRIRAEIFRSDEISLEIVKKEKNYI